MQEPIIFCRMNGKYYGHFDNYRDITAEGDTFDELVKELQRLLEVYFLSDFEIKLEEMLWMLHIDLSYE